MSPFSIFCALYLGITERDGYELQAHRDVARRFEMSDDELGEYLEANRLSQDAVVQCDFDLPSARLDIEVAPEGISRIELARSLFEEFEASADDSRGTTAE